MSLRKTGWLVWLFFLTGAAPAAAHSPVPGIEGFYLGMIHPFSTPAQSLVLVGLGLLIGGFRIDTAWLAIAAFFGASLVGLTIGNTDNVSDTALFAVAFGASAFAALMPGKFAPLAIAVVTIGGFLIGEASIPDGGQMRDRLFTMSGSIVGSTIGLFYLFGVIIVIRERFTWGWVAIAFRIAAAWVGAISLVMLALNFAQDTLPA